MEASLTEYLMFLKDAWEGGGHQNELGDSQARQCTKHTELTPEVQSLKGTTSGPRAS